MTDTTLPPDGGAGDRIEPVDIQQEMQSSYIDYAMSVIVGRALPDVRDGLKPVHRRVLYAMYDNGFRPDRGYVKSARAVAETMGNYHPHGDASIYDTLVRLAQPWSMRYPLVDGQGNFGSRGNDGAAAMRYCVTGDALVRLPQGRAIRIADLVPRAKPNSDNMIDAKVIDRHGNSVCADVLFHSGTHRTRTVQTKDGYELSGTDNHPLLCLVDVAGVPTLLWKLIEEITPGDRVVIQRVPPSEFGAATAAESERALLTARSAGKSVPEWVWHSSAAVKQIFLGALFEGDGSCSALPRNTIELSYSTRSEELAKDVQQLLLDFGVLSRRYLHATGEHKVVVTNRREAALFARRIGFVGRKQETLLRVLRDGETASPVAVSRSLGSDAVPGLSEFLRTHGSSDRRHRSWLRRHNVDRIARWEYRRDEILGHITDPDARAIAEDLTDGRFYYATVAAVVDNGEQPVYSLRVDTDDHAFVTNGFVSHNTECRLTPLAMEMLREIDHDTVDFAPNYDGRTQEPTVLPARVPNLLINGSGGIAVGMATNMPPHNLREVAEAIYWALENYDADEEATLAAVMERVKGPDFPTHGLIVGGQGIHDAYTTGRGAIRMRGVVEIEEGQRGATQIVITELPYQVNPDNLITSIAEQVRDGKIAGISDIYDESSDRAGMRIVVIIKRDAVAKVVLNNLYKHTQLQTSFGANMLVDRRRGAAHAAPRPDDPALCQPPARRHRAAHPLPAAQGRGTRPHPARSGQGARCARRGHRADPALARPPTSHAPGLMDLLDIDEIQATAILDMQLRRLAALERQKIVDELAKIEAEIADLKDILAKPERQRAIVRDELTEIVDKYGDDRRTRIIAADGDVADEDLIAREDVVVTITETGYAKRTKTDLYRAQKRGGKGVQGAGLKQDDIVEHFFVCSTHDWILFFTNKGRVYRAKAYELPEANRDGPRPARREPAGLPAGRADRPGHPDQGLRGRAVPGAGHPARAGQEVQARPTSTRTGPAASSRSTCATTTSWSAPCCARPTTTCCWFRRKGQSIRFSATDEALRPMGRATSGVQGMRFNADDELLSLNVVREGTYLLVATSGGYAKRTAIEEYPVQGRGGKGVLTIQYDRRRGKLVGALIVDDDDELYAITSGGGVIRTAARQVRKAGRQTKGVRLMNLGEGDTLLAIARNADEPDEPASGGQ